MILVAFSIGAEIHGFVTVLGIAFEQRALLKRIRQQND
jgi:hypothetical protein